VRVASPYALVAVGVCAAALLLLVWLARRPARNAVVFTNVDLLAGCVTRGSHWRMRIPAALALLALVCAASAFAQPERRVRTPRAGGSVVLVVDVSGSMAAGDVVPTRMAAARTAVARFLGRLPPGTRVGLVVFASRAEVAAPLTTDRSMVSDALRYTPPPGAGTAIGDALARAATLHPRTIVLLSDGAQNRGRLTPAQGAARAAAAGIAVHTVALGTSGGEIHEGVIPLRVPPDPGTLRRIAAVSGGGFHQAMDGRTLRTVYAALADRIGWQTGWDALAPWLLALAACAALAATALSVAKERFP
jgi:Ca-activated chloride channel family protein